MNSPSRYTQDAEEQYIDPRKLFFTGGGIDDPFYNSGAAQASDDSINLEEHVDMDGLAEGDFTIENLPGQGDIGTTFIQLTVAPKLQKAPRSALRPEAPSFVPRIGRPSLTEDTGLHVGHARRRSRSTTPRIRLYQSVDGPTASRCPVDLHDRQDASPRRRSTSRQRSASISKPRQNHTTSKPPPTSSFGSDHLSPIMNAAAANWVVRDSYHIGDRSANSCAAQPQQIYATPGHLYSAGAFSTSSQSSGGYHCTFSGCDESYKAWDTQCDLNHHSRQHLPESQRPHGCPYCEKRFCYPKDVRRHLKTKIHTRTQETCPTCHNSISRKDNLNRHMASQHSTTSTSASASGSQNNASSPSVSSIASFAQSPFSETVPTTPQTRSPWTQPPTFILQPTIPFLDDTDDSDPFYETSSKPSAHPMLKSYSN